ncbi:MAG TPA: hypothetical protein VGA37_07225 [Gemmatimonadales bacterium]
MDLMFDDHRTSHGRAPGAGEWRRFEGDGANRVVANTGVGDVPVTIRSQR